MAELDPIFSFQLVGGKLVFESESFVGGFDLSEATYTGGDDDSEELQDPPTISGGSEYLSHYLEDDNRPNNLDYRELGPADVPPEEEEEAEEDPDISINDIFGGNSESELPSSESGLPSSEPELPNDDIFNAMSDPEEEDIFSGGLEPITSDDIFDEIDEIDAVFGGAEDPEGEGSFELDTAKYEAIGGSERPNPYDYPDEGDGFAGAQDDPEGDVPGAYYFE